MTFIAGVTAVEAFKASMNGFNRFCTSFIATIQSEPDISITLSVSATIGAVFNKKKSVTFQWSTGRWTLNSVKVNPSDISTVLLSEFAWFQGTTLKVVHSLEERCTAHDLTIVYEEPTEPDVYTIYVKVYQATHLRFKVQVKQNISMRSVDFNTVIYDANDSHIDLSTLGGFLTTTDQFFQTPDFVLRMPRMSAGRQETSQLWHAVGKLATLVDKLV